MISKRSGVSGAAVFKLFVGSVVILDSQTPSLFGLSLRYGGNAARVRIRTATAPG